MLRNPFEIRNPETLSAKLICDLFVKDYTEYNSLTSYKHTFAYGSRGSGKSMQFRYLEPRCQALEEGSLTNFLNVPGAFISIYIKCNKGDLTKSEFNALLEQPDVSPIISQRIVVHYFIMDITEHILVAFRDQLGELMKDSKIQEHLFQRVLPSLDRKNIHTSFISEKNLASLLEIVRAEKDMVDQSILDYFSHYGSRDCAFQYSGNYCSANFKEGEFLRDLVIALREIVINRELPFFLLFDDADALSDFQKKIINTLISQRIQDAVCIKVSSLPTAYNVDITMENKRIEETHDYYVIEFDSLYTNNRFAYYDRIRAIANRRLSIAKFDVTEIKDFLPPNPTDDKKKAEAEQYVASEYDKMDEKHRPLDRTNYIKKYTMARFLQVYFPKAKYGYSGFDNLVHFSSGIVRFFLEPCFKMVERYIAEHPGEPITGIKYIPVKIQEDVIEKYSNEFIDSKLDEPIRKGRITDEEKTIMEGLYNLLTVLGSIFKLRLKNLNSREPRIISFAAKKRIRNQKINNVLQLAVKEAFLHRKWYRAKSGFEMLECYVLNRRLGPRYELDLSGFQGRIELSEMDLLQSIDDPDAFISKFVAREKVQGPSEPAEQLAFADF